MAADVLDTQPPNDAEDLDAQVANFTLGAEPEPEPEPTPQEPETTPTPAPVYSDWNDRLPDDPQLPPTYRGQRTLGDLWNERVDLTHRMHRAGQVINDKDAEIRALRATLEIVGRQGQPAQAEPAKPRLREEAGIDFERDLITDPNGAMDRYGAKLAERLEETTRNEVAEVRKKLADMEASATIDGMRAASESARQALQVPEEIWTARLNDMMTSIYRGAGDLSAFRDPRWWYYAHQDGATRWSAPTQTPPPVHETAASSSTPAPVRRGPGSNSRTASTTARKGSPIPARLQGIATSLAKEFNIKLEDLEQEIAKDNE